MILFVIFCPATAWPSATDTASFSVPAKPAASAAPATACQQLSPAHSISAGGAECTSLADSSAVSAHASQHVAFADCSPPPAVVAERAAVRSADSSSASLSSILMRFICVRHNIVCVSTSCPLLCLLYSRQPVRPFFRCLLLPPTTWSKLKRGIQFGTHASQRAFTCKSIELQVCKCCCYGFSHPPTRVRDL